MSDEINKTAPDLAVNDAAAASVPPQAETVAKTAKDATIEQAEDAITDAEAQITADAAETEQTALNDELEQLRSTFQSELDKAAEEARAAEEMQPVIQELEEGADPDEEEDEETGDDDGDVAGYGKKTKRRKKEKTGKKRPVGLIVALVLVCVLIVTPLAGYFVLSVKEPNVNAFVSAYISAETAGDPALQRSKYIEALSFCTEGSLFEGQKQLITEKVVAATCASEGYAAAKTYMESNMDEEMRANPKTRDFKNFLEIPEKLEPAFNALPERLPAAIQAAGSAADVDCQALAKDLNVPAVIRDEAAAQMEAICGAIGTADSAADDDAYYNAMRDYLTAYQSVSAMGVTAQKLPEDIVARLYARGYAYEASMVLDQIFTQEMRDAIESETVKTAATEIDEIKASGVNLWGIALMQHQAGKTAESDLIAAMDAPLSENGKKALARYASELILAMDAEAESNLTLARRHYANVVSAEETLKLPVTDTAIRLARVLLASGDVSNAYNYTMRYALPSNLTDAEDGADVSAQTETQLFAEHPEFQSDYTEIIALYNAQTEVEEVFSEAYYTTAYGGSTFDAAAVKSSLDALLSSSSSKYTSAYVNYYKYVCEIYGDMNKENMLAHILAAETDFGAHRVICLADKAQIYLSLGQNEAAFTAALDMLSVDVGSDLANSLMAKQQRIAGNAEDAMAYAQRGIDAAGADTAVSCEEEAAVFELLNEKYADAYQRIKSLYTAARTNSTLTVETVELAMVIAHLLKSADETEQAEIDAFAAELNDLLTQSGRTVSANTQAVLNGEKTPAEIYLGENAAKQAE